LILIRGFAKCRSFTLSVLFTAAFVCFLQSMFALAQTATSAGCTQCENQTEEKPQAAQKLLDQAAEIYGKNDPCLRALGPDSIRIYKCMQKFYDHFLDEPITDKQANQEITGCAGLERSPESKAAALGLVTSFVKKKLEDDGTRIFDKLSKGQALTFSIFGRLVLFAVGSLQ